MTAGDADPLLRRLERRAFGFCAVAAAIAWWARGGSPDVALGVVGGAVLIGVSYWAIRSSIDGIMALAMSASAPAPTRMASAAANLPAVRAVPAGLKADGSETQISSEQRGFSPADAAASTDAADPEPPASSPADAAIAPERPRRGRALVYGARFIGRYAVLGVLAYVMLVWLRLHPVGVIIGVSSIAVAAAWEAASSLSAPARPRG